MQSFLPKALLFKEWKEHKWWMTAGFILLLVGPFVDVMRVADSLPSIAGRRWDMFWQVLTPQVYGTRVLASSWGYPTSFQLPNTPYVNPNQGIVAMGLMIALITVERNRGALWFTLAGPVSRAALLRVKAVLALIVVTGAWVLKFFLMIDLNVITGNHVSVSLIFDWLGSNLLFSLTLMAVGLACASFMMVGFAAGVTAVMVSAIPTALGRAVLSAGAVANPHNTVQVAHGVPGHPILAGVIANTLRAVSPWNYASSGMGTDSFSTGSAGPPPFFVIGENSHPMGWMAIWLVVWVVLWGYLGWRSYSNAPLENNNQFLLFPQLWPWAVWFIAGVVSYFGVSMALTNHGVIEQEPYAILVRFLAAWVLLGLVSSAALRLWVRRGASVTH